MKLSDIGTSNPFMARLCFGVIDTFEFSSLSMDKRQTIFEKFHEIVLGMVELEKIAKPILDEIGQIIVVLNQEGIPVDVNDKPFIPQKCSGLEKSVDFLARVKIILVLYFEFLSLLWDQDFDPMQPQKLYEFALSRFGKEHILTKLLYDDQRWLMDLNDLINSTEEPGFLETIKDFEVSGNPDNQLVLTPPCFSKGLQIASHLEGTINNIFTFMEEIAFFSIAEFLDSRLAIHEIPEQLRKKEAPARFRVGVKPGVDNESFKNDPRFSKIYRTGGNLFHLREHIRENKFGKVRPIIHAEYQGKKTVGVGNTIYIGNWKTFHDFLMYHIRIKFGEEWRLEQTEKSEEDRSPIMDWAIKAAKYQKQAVVKEGELYQTIPNGPMHAFSSLAYDLFVLEDNHRLQNSLIERMKKPEKSTFWGARYEAMVASTLIKAGFDIEYEDETDSNSKHPEFIAVNRRTGERIAVEAKKRNRTQIPQNESEIRLGIEDLLKKAVEKFNGMPFVVFVELDLPPIHGNPMEKPWFKELMDSHERAGVRDVDSKDFCNLIVFTNYPTENPEDESKFPPHSYIATISQVPKCPLQHSIHLHEITAAVNRHTNIPTWFEE